MAADDSRKAAEPKTAGAREPKKKPSKAKLRKRRALVHRCVRIAIQIVFFIFAPGVWNSAMNGIHYLATQVGNMQAIEMTGFLLTLIAVLGYTVLFGRFFCGYACAFGTMGDILYLIGTPLRRLLPFKEKNPHPRLNMVLRLFKYVVLLAVCALCFFNVWSKVSPYSPWTAFGILDSATISGLNKIGVVVLVLIMIMQMLWERSFCSFLCPMGAVFSLMPVLPISGFGRKLSKCGKKPCNQCLRNCAVGILPDQEKFSIDECIQCGRCADVCPLENVTLVRVGERFKFKGNSIAWTVIKAAILFLIFFLLGAVRYVG